MNPTVISFYTSTWDYPKYAKKMMKDCDRLGLEHYIVQRQDTGDWLKNTRMKPQFIKEALDTLQKPVLWIDADGTLRRFPKLLCEDYPHDFAARPMAPERDRTWHVGTMYFKYNEKVMAFVNEWAERSLDAKASDELLLDQMWNAHSGPMKDLSIGELPASYFEMLRLLNQAPKSTTIICHRASKSESKLAMKARAKQREKNSSQKTK